MWNKLASVEELPSARLFVLVPWPELFHMKQSGSLSLLLARHNRPTWNRNYEACFAEWSQLWSRESCTGSCRRNLFHVERRTKLAQSKHGARRGAIPECRQSSLDFLFFRALKTPEIVLETLECLKTEQT